MDPSAAPPTLERLAALVAERSRDGEASPRMAKLLARGLPQMCKKLGEEATEVVVAALAQDRGALIDEIADLLYHLLVLMQTSDVEMSDITSSLEQRVMRSTRKAAPVEIAAPV